MASNAQNPSDEELARQAHAGSLQAFDELVYRYEHRIYGFVANVCRNGTDAREVTQDTFVRAFQAIHQFDARQTFAPWLFTIARRKAIDHYRAAAPLADEAAPEQISPGDPAELLAQYIAMRLLSDFQKKYKFEPQMLSVEVEETIGQSATCEMYALQTS